jgi:hypothetical protein
MESHPGATRTQAIPDIATQIQRAGTNRATIVFNYGTPWASSEKDPTTLYDTLA